MIEDGLEIRRVVNGFLIKTEADEDNIVVCEDNGNELVTMQNLLNYVKEYFDCTGSKHDKERLFVEIKKQH